MGGKKVLQSSRFLSFSCIRELGFEVVSRLVVKLGWKANGGAVNVYYQQVN